MVIPFETQVVVYAFDKDGKVLFYEKLTKHCAGRLVGPGGKVKPTERPHQAAVREFNSEAGGATIKEQDLELRAKLIVELDALKILLYVFTAGKFYGNPGPSDELANPGLYPVHPLPNNLPPGDSEWLPKILVRDGQQYIGHIKKATSVATPMRVFLYPASISE